MNLNVYILADYLSLEIHHVITTLSLTECSIQYIDFYAGSFQNQNSIIIIDKKYLSEVLKKEGLYICAASYTGQEMSDKCSVIFVDERYTAMDIFRALTDVFEKFRKLEEQLYQLAAEQADYHAFGNIMLPLFNNPIATYTAAHRNLFFCEDNPKDFYREYLGVKEYSYLEDQDIQEMKLDSDFIATIQTVTPSIFPASMWGYRILYYNIRLSNLYVARSMIYEVERPLKKSDWALLEFWSHFLTYKIRIDPSLEGPSHPPKFDDILSGLLRKDPLERELCENVLSKYGWSIYDRYICICIEQSKYDQQANTSLSICVNLEIQIRGSAAVVADNNILLIVNIGEKSFQDTLIRETLSSFLRDNILKAGISQEFSNLFHLSDYYEQTKMALQAGKTIDPMYWIYYYDNYILSSCINEFTGRYSLRSLCLEVIA